MITTTLSAQAAHVIRTADFRSAWPIEVRKALVKAAKTEGDLPPYAVKEVTWAIKTARAIEKRLNDDVVRGEATLSLAERRRLALADA